MRGRLGAADRFAKSLPWLDSDDEPRSDCDSEGRFRVPLPRVAVGRIRGPNGNCPNPDPGDIAVPSFVVADADLRCCIIAETWKRRRNTREFSSGEVVLRVEEDHCIPARRRPAYPLGLLGMAELGQWKSSPAVGAHK